MTKETFKLFQGDTSPVKLTRPDMNGAPTLLDGSWACQQSVVDCAGNVVVAAEAVTAKTTDADGKERFVVALTPTHTASLAVTAGEAWLEYEWIIQVTNTTTSPAYNREHRITLQMMAQGIP